MKENIIIEGQAIRVAGCETMRVKQNNPRTRLQLQITEEYGTISCTNLAASERHVVLCLMDPTVRYFVARYAGLNAESCWV